MQLNVLVIWVNRGVESSTEMCPHLQHKVELVYSVCWTLITNIFCGIHGQDLEAQGIAGCLVSEPQGLIFTLCG